MATAETTNQPVEQLTGDELNAKITELVAERKTESEVAVACGYFSVRTDAETGKEVIRPNTASFRRAQLAAMGAALPSSSGPRGGAGRLHVTAAGLLIVGKRYTDEIAEIGDVFSVDVDREERTITLKFSESGNGVEEIKAGRKNRKQLELTATAA